MTTVSGAPYLHVTELTIHSAKNVYLELFNVPIPKLRVDDMVFISELMDVPGRIGGGKLVSQTGGRWKVGPKRGGRWEVGPQNRWEVGPQNRWQMEVGPKTGGIWEVKTPAKPRQY